MQQKKLRIAVPEPCHERWDQMSPTEKGAYCKSCAKEVRDFTKMTQAEIAYFLKHNKEEKTCGRFRNDQLVKLYTLPVDAPLAPRRVWLNLLLLIPMALLGKSAYGQQKPPVCERPADYDKRQTQQPVTAKPDSLQDEILEKVMIGQAILPFVPDTLTEATTWQGRVINAANKAALPLAELRFDKTTAFTTDSTGRFNITIPEDKAWATVTITVPGFVGKTIALSKKGTASLPGEIELDTVPVFEWNFGPDSVIFSDATFPTCGVTLGWTVTTEISGNMVMLEESDPPENIPPVVSDTAAAPLAENTAGPFPPQAAMTGVPENKTSSPTQPEPAKPENEKQAVLPGSTNNNRKKK